MIVRSVVGLATDPTKTNFPGADVLRNDYYESDTYRKGRVKN